MVEFFKLITPFAVVALLVITFAFQLAVFYYFVTHPERNQIKKYLFEETDFWELNDAVKFFKSTLLRDDIENIGGRKK